MPRETAVSLIKDQVLPRLGKVEGEVKTVRTILVAGGLDNGNGEAVNELNRLLREGVKVQHRREITRQFFELWFGWLPDHGRFYYASATVFGTIAVGIAAVFQIADYIGPFLRAHGL